MSYSKKGMLALLRDLMERDRGRHARLTEVGRAVKTAPATPPRALRDAGWSTTSSFDLATASSDAMVRRRSTS